MRFDFRRVDQLPRLAWCATLTRGHDSVVVHHGPWVETRDDCFFEAAWDGDFRAGRFDEAATMLGTGARIDGDLIVFSTATDTDFYLFSVASGDTLIVSNSLAFAMVQGKTSPDIRHPYYLYDFFALRRTGLTRDPRRLRTADGKRLNVHMYQRFAVNQRLDIEARAMTHQPLPVSFDSHVATVRMTMAAVFENAAHPGRRYPFTPITMISRGYDSTAVSALAAKLGCRHAITFSTGELGYDDNGADNAARLGLSVTTSKQFDFQRLPGHPEAEFCASNPSGSGMLIAGLSQQLEGRILLKGDSGDFVWSLSEIDAARDLRRPQIRALATASMNEFRLRTGTLIFDVPGIGAIHSTAIHALSSSPEMRPWSIGGTYDRPIPRRIAEEAGLPRNAFGQEKMYGANLAGDEDTLKPETVADFDRFYAAANVPWSFRQRHRYLRRDTLTRPVDALLEYLRDTPGAAKLYKRFAPWLMNVTAHRANDWRRLSPYLYLFHWGFDQTKARYEL